MVGFGYSLPMITVIIDSEHESAIIPTIGPTILAMMYPKPILDVPESVSVTIVAMRSLPE